jgi:putative holliday junction resolvase
MRVAALDLGKVRIGLAVNDELGLMAHPRAALDARDRRALYAVLAEFAREETIELFLIGIPLDRDGAVGPAARKAETFAEQVKLATGCQVEFFDERLTTTEAHRRLREGGHNARSSRSKVDSAAACLMLQAWLDRHQGIER